MGRQGTIADWREVLLTLLKHSESQGIATVKWSTANDRHVCPLCASREGKIYTIAEAKRELQGEFCKPGDPDDKCRCSFYDVSFKQSSNNRHMVRRRKTS